MKGVNLIVADALSRAFVCNDNNDDCEQRPRIMNVNAFDNFSDARLLEVKNPIEKDANLQSVTELILNGWPEDKDRVPNSSLPFFDMHDELSVVDDASRNEIEITSFTSWIRQYDAKSAKHDILAGNRERRKTLVDNCEIYQESKPRNCCETLKQHDN